MNARRLFFAMVALLCSAVVTAQSFAVNGIFYNITSSTTLTVEVTISGFFGLTIEYSGSVVIPEKVTYNSREYSVTSIGDYAFRACKDLTNIKIPSSVTSIGVQAFEYCSGLTSIKIPSSVTSIGDRAFFGCNGLTSIKIPSSVTSIGDRALSGCYSLTSIVVDKGNSVYDSRDNCNAIIETSTNKLIQGCKNTTIPTSVTTIGSYAFFGCHGLTSIKIPSSVTTIGVEAFEYCSSLTNIEIPSSVTSIGDRVFFGCKGLTNITSYIPADSLFALTEYTFSGLDKAACTLYVPYGAKTTYAATSGWKGFKKIVEREL